MKNGHMLAGLSAALTISIMSVAASGEDSAPKLNPRALATALVENGQAAEACALLNVVYGSGTTNAEALYLFGECHLAQGKAVEAARYYERALRQKPAAIAVRAKLAGVYLRLGRAEDARTLMAAATHADPMNPAAAELASLAETSLDAETVTAAAPRSWTAEVSLARIYDSNANGGSIASTVDAVIGGVPLTLDIAPSSQAKPDWGTVVAASGSYLHPLAANYSLILRGDASATLYDDESQYNRQTIGAGIGILYRDTRLTWSVVPNLRHTWQDGEPDELLAAVDGRANYRLTPQLSLTGAAQLGYASVPFDHDRDSWIGLAAAGIEYAFNPAVSGGVQLVARRSVGDVTTEAYAGIGPEIYLSAALTDILTLDASYGFTHVEYDDSLGMFPQGRSDNKHSFGAALNLDLAEWREGLSLFARYNYVNTDSSVDLYTSDRHLVSAGVKYRF